MTQINLNSGSDLEFEIVWPSGQGDDAGPENITGHVVDMFECSPQLAPNITVAIGDATAGQIVGLITWSSAFTKGRSMSFILRKTNGARRLTLPRITVNVI